MLMHQPSKVSLVVPMNVDTAPAVGSRTESIVAVMSMEVAHRERRSSPDSSSADPDMPPPG